MSDAGRDASCCSCAHFRNDAKYLEAEFPGWTALGSAYGSTRAEDGICGLHGIYLSATQCCSQHKPNRGSPSQSVAAV
jgi:hypothetical protein